MRESENNRVSQSFAKGALIMTICMVIVKIMGAFFKIPLAKILGGEGMGYFNSAYSLYNPIYAFATAGLPIAIARMVSGDVARKRFKDVKKIHKISIPMFILTGTLGMLIMLVGSFMYARITKAPGVLYSIFMLAPTVLFSCLISIYKGYYEGLSNMAPTATSEIVEAVGKVVFGLGLSYGVVSCGMNEYYAKGTVFGKACYTEEMARSATLPFASAGAVLGITLGAVAGYLYIYGKYKMTGDKITLEEIENSPESRPTKKLIRMLLEISVPIGLGAIIMNFAGIVDSVLIQRRLNDIMMTNPNALLNVYHGLIPLEIVERQTTHIFLSGCFGYMSTITMLIPAITQGIAISAMPSVTTVWVQGDRKKIKQTIQSIFKITTLISVPAGLGLSFLSYPIMDLIYGSIGKGTQPCEIYIAAHIMTVAGIATIFSSISTPLCNMLQAVGRVDLPVKLLTIGVIIKVLLNYSLVGIPEINIQGASVGTLVCYLFVCLMALYYLCVETKIRPDFKSIIIKPLISSGCCAIAAYASQGLLSRIVSYKIATILSIIIAVVVYIATLLLTKTLNRDDFKMLPKGDKILMLLEKYNLV